MHDVKVVGITCWIGKVPQFVRDVLEINSRSFDEIILISDQWEGSLPSNVKPVDAYNVYPKVKQLASTLTPASFSDFVSYYPEMIFNWCNLPLPEAVMFFDSDFICPNRLLLIRLFDSYDNDIIAHETSYYPGNFGELFANPCMTYCRLDTTAFLNSTKLIDRWRKVVNESDRYGAGSASMLNGYFKDQMEDCRLPGKMRIRTLRPVDNLQNVVIEPDLLGIHLEVSTLLKYNIFGNQFNDMKIKLRPDGSIRLDSFINKKRGYKNLRR